MRIIGGYHRSRKLFSPEDDCITRPITDRVKQSVFDRLWAMGVLESGNVVDVFAGVGSLGLEALSRGCDHCTFIERHRDIKALLEKNIDALDYREQATALPSDALAGAWVALLSRKPVQLVFLDPPYVMMQEPESKARVMGLLTLLHPHMSASGVAVVRMPEHVKLDALPGWQEPELYDYGSMSVAFMRPFAPAA